MPDIKIRVGAALDSSLNAVFRTLIDASRKAGRQVAADSAKAGKDTASAYRGGMSEALKAIQAADKEAAKSAKEATRAAEKEAKERIRIEREKAAAIAYIKRINSRAEEREFKDRERAMQSATGRAGRIAGGVTRGIAGLGRSALGTGADLARAMGVNADVGSQLGASVSRETIATQISNSSSTGNGKLVNPQELMAQANAVAMQTGTSAEDNLKGLQAFVGLTGDLKTGRDILSDMGQLSKATGSSMEDMVNAAAQVANAMGDIPDKGKAISQTMRVFAGQGQIGAVEIKDMAGQMAKLAAQANNFRIDPKSAALLAGKGVTTTTGQNLAVMGAMAQIARAQGGRATAPLAMGSSMAFERDLSNRTELKRMDAAGINVFTDKSKTLTRDPKAIMLDILSKTKGSMPAIANLLPNQNSRAVVNGLSQDYRRGSDSVARNNGEGDLAFEQRRNAAGVKAASDAFDRFLTVAMDSPEITAKFNAAMATAESRSQLLNNQFAQTADALREGLYPAFVALTPLVLKASTAFSEWMGRFTGTTSKALDDRTRNLELENVAAQHQMKLDAAPAPGRGMLRFPEFAGTPQVSPDRLIKSHDDMTNAMGDLQAEKTRLQGLLPPDKGGTNTDTFRVAKNLMGGAAGDEDNRIALDAVKQKIDSMQQSLITNEDMQKAFVAALNSGVILDVKVTNLPPPALPASGGGRMPFETRNGT